MISKEWTEIVKEYDIEGRLIKETITETIEDDDNLYSPYAYRINPESIANEGDFASMICNTPIRSSIEETTHCRCGCAAQEITEFEKLRRAAQPLVDYIRENYDPHTTVLVEDDFVTVRRDEMGVPFDCD